MSYISAKILMVLLALSFWDFDIINVYLIGILSWDIDLPICDLNKELKLFQARHSAQFSSEVKGQWKLLKNITQPLDKLLKVLNYLNYWTSWTIWLNRIWHEVLQKSCFYLWICLFVYIRVQYWKSPNVLESLRCCAIQNTCSVHSHSARITVFVKAGRFLPFDS